MDPPVDIPPELFERLARAFRHVDDIDRFLELLAESVRETVAAQSVRIHAGGEPRLTDVNGIARSDGELRIDDSEICVPLAIHGRMLGTMHLVRDEAPFHPRDLFLLSALTDFVAAVLDARSTAPVQSLPTRAPAAATAAAAASVARVATFPSPPDPEGPVPDTGVPAVVVLHPRDSIASSVRWILEPDCRVTHSPTADDLYHRIELAAPRLVLLTLDLVLPPARAVVDEIRTRAPALPIIGLATSSWTTPPPPGIDAVIRDPSDVREVRRLVHECLMANSTEKTS